MSNKDSYLSISKTSEGLYKEKGSKFLAFAFPCNDPEKAKEIIQDLRKEHHTAVHVCFAWRFGTSEPFEDRFSDDGEPNNSAGKPIFGQIQSFQLTNVLIAVVRYYGGTKLGVGGLINAYKTAAKESLENAVLKSFHIETEFKVRYPYEHTGTVMQVLNSFGVNILEQGFDQDLPFILASLRDSLLSPLLEVFKKYPDISLTIVKKPK